MASSPAVEIRNLHKSFGRKKILCGVDLTLPLGHSLVILGASGSGKSVLLKCLLGLLAPDQGEIYINGFDATAANGVQRRELLLSIGMLFQNGALFDSLPVWRNVAFGLIETRGVPAAKAREIAEQTLVKVGLAPEIGQLWPGELSGGMQKRVSLARAIAYQPQILLLDEPTTGLDPIMANIINELIVLCARDLQAGTITITHDIGSAQKIADQVALLYQGKIIWRGGKDDLRQDQAPLDNPYADQFIHGRSTGPFALAVSKGNDKSQGNEKS